MFSAAELDLRRHRYPPQAIIRIGSEPGLTIPDLEQYRDSQKWPRDPGSFIFVFGWNRPHRMKVGVRSMTIDIFRHLEAEFQTILRDQYVAQGMPPRDEFLIRMTDVMAKRVIARLESEYPDVGASAPSGRGVSQFAAWILLTNAVARAVLKPLATLLTVQIIFAYEDDRFVVHLAADHGEEPPRLRN